MAIANETIKAGAARKVLPSKTASEARFAIEDRMAGISIGVAIAALSIGVTIGLMQGLEHAGIDLYKYAFGMTYYQGLTLHGVLNALVWTTFFIVGFFTFVLVRSLDRPLAYPQLNMAGLVIMIIGVVSAAIPMLTNAASVLYTFYPPLQATWPFYVGLTLVIVGSWVVGWGFLATFFAWRKANPGVTTPFLALGSLITMVMWQIATLGVATEMLALLIPWSLGWVEGTDPLLARTFFWFFGHPLVYFWLLPAYLSWYGMLPKIAGGKIFSEQLARLVFWLFLLLSIPVGMHHQFTDPGIPAAWKFLHGVITYSLAIPSFLTAFTVVASLEVGARARGGKGYFAWIFKLPWDNPAFAAQNFAMILFAFGGIGGLTNASYNLNLAVHNTSWIPGHFHLTLGSATTLTFMGILYWLLPKLTGRQLFTRRIALAQAWTWFIGMIFFSNGLHSLGIMFGVPRRTMLGATPYFNEAWRPFLTESAFGGVLLFISALLFFTVIIGTLVNPKRVTEPIEMPVAEDLSGRAIPAWLNNWKPWLYGTVILILLGYGPILYVLIRDAQLLSPGLRVW